MWRHRLASHRPWRSLVHNWPTPGCRPLSAAHPAVSPCQLHARLSPLVSCTSGCRPLSAACPAVAPCQRHARSLPEQCNPHSAPAPGPGTPPRGGLPQVRGRVPSQACCSPPPVALRRPADRRPGVSCASCGARLRGLIWRLGHWGSCRPWMAWLRMGATLWLWRILAALPVPARSNPPLSSPFSTATFQLYPGPLSLVSVSMKWPTMSRPCH